MEKKLGLFPMVASILAGMIGSGVYDIAYQLGSVASPGGAIVAWATCFVGMLMFIRKLLKKKRVSKNVPRFPEKAGAQRTDSPSNYTQTSVRQKKPKSPSKKERTA